MKKLILAIAVFFGWATALSAADYGSPVPVLVLPAPPPKKTCDCETTRKCDCGNACACPSCLPHTTCGCGKTGKCDCVWPGCTCGGFCEQWRNPPPAQTFPTPFPAYQPVYYSPPQFFGGRMPMMGGGGGC